MAVKILLRPLITTMRGDIKYKTLRETFTKHENFRLPVESLMKELSDSHQIRKVRRLNTTDPQFIDNLIEANLHDQATRSRATEILIRAVRAHTLLTNAVDSLRYYLVITYSEELKSFKTKEERLQIVNMSLKSFEVFLTEVSVLKETAQLIVADIDKASWTLKNIITAFSLHHSPESRI